MTDSAPDTQPEADASQASHRGHRGNGASAAGAGLVALVRETVIVVTIALALSLLVKTFLVQAFFIPSESMEDTLLIGDRVIVSKLTPGPFDLQRGQVVVFVDPGGWLEPNLDIAPEPGPVRKALAFVGLLPHDSNDHLIKRIIGMPGDRVQFRKDVGKLEVNGVAIDEPYLGPSAVPSESDFDITVPKGRVWVMGDNRQHSQDSRFHDKADGDGSAGSVPISQITGRAVAVVWPVSHATGLSRPERVFAKVPAPASS